MVFEIINEFKNLIFHKDFFKTYETSDFTINSRVLLRDLITTSINNGLEVSLNNEVKSIQKKITIKFLAKMKVSFVKKLQYVQDIILINLTMLKPKQLMHLCQL